MKRIDPSDIPECCYESWLEASKDIWENKDLPERFVCLECGNYMVPAPWQVETGVEGIHAEGFNCLWYYSEGFVM